eukprot:jgi/Psemu1/262445/estExt_Genewise1Plus.C_7700008
MGLQITLAQDDEIEHKIVLKYHQDRHFQYIHPHVFAPACMSDVRRMGGGGSGVAVFCGQHPELGEIVMKHGGFNDVKELFALTKISSELKRRGGIPAKDSPASEAARSMAACLPEFKMVYISPQHLVFKEKAMWGKLRKLIKFAMVSLDDTAFLSPGTSIRIYECSSDKATVYLDTKDRKKPSLAFVLPKERIKSIDQFSVELEFSQGLDSLQNIYDGLHPMMTKHLFKFTLAQKRIGGENATTGNQWMYKGVLDGLLLGNLISKFIKTIHNLQALTLPEEIDVADEVRKEVERIKASAAQADSLSTVTDQFMGNAIKKNFDPNKGRMRLLRRTCREFQENLIHLEPGEELPAKYLGALVKEHASMSDVFVGASTEPPRIHPDKDFWINLMTQAVSDREGMSPNATKRIWTSGLADAGIHNLFLSTEHLYFFDLGVPQLQSLPGFMTKFLFSFFHVLGMQEDENDHDEWVRRFVPQGEKLALTIETNNLLSEAYYAFEVSLNRIIEEIFDGDNHLRWLLLQYVTLQLLSDASFCLQRWNIKGGGRPREDNYNKNLEKWLWRALWDVYIAFDINTTEAWDRFKVEHDSCEENRSPIGEGIRRSILSYKLDPKTLEEDLKDSIDDEKDGVGVRRYSDPVTEVSEQKEPNAHRRFSHRELRWPAERLRKSTLRELTAATFDYHSDVPTSDDSDDEPSDHDSYIDVSAIPSLGLDVTGKSSISSFSKQVSMNSVPEEREE